MRTWRVGTFSMGISLVLLGLILFLSQFLGFDLITVMTSWWPILLVVLGIEILVYLFLSRRESPALKYDFLSILMVGLIGTAGIGFAAVSSTGLLGKVEEVMARENQTFDLPNYSYHLNDNIKRIVLNSEGYHMTVEASSEKEISLFGTYQVESAKRQKLIKNAEDYVAANRKGDTLYLTIKSLPNDAGPFFSQANATATLILPSTIKLEMTGGNQSVSLKPRYLSNDWTIDHCSSVFVDASENSNLTLSAVGIESVTGKDGMWKESESVSKGETVMPSLKNAVYQSGEGQYHINISNTNQVSLTSK
jgi:hypothetical protein